MKQFNLAEWALKHKSIIYYFMFRASSQAG
ncbi:hypothetical protein Q604_UNBC03842G0001, partial [human gut metagenome]